MPSLPSSAPSRDVAELPPDRVLRNRHGNQLTLSNSLGDHAAKADDQEVTKPGFERRADDQLGTRRRSAAAG